MDGETWRAVDDYFAEALVEHDAVLHSVLEASREAGLPDISVTRAQGKLLQILALTQGARRILEIGTLGAYSTIWLARSLPPGGRVVTLEADRKHADVARANIERAGLTETVELIVGRAQETLPKLAAQGRDPFDLVFIDADKPSNPEYFRWALKLSRPGTLIVVDNVVRNGAVADPASTDPGVQGVRRLRELVAVEPRVSATAIQTVGGKGYDGFLIALVLADA